jgi:glycine oxidase
LEAAAGASGADILTASAVDAALLEGDRLVGVRTADGTEHRAGQVVLAAGSWSAADWLPAALRPPVRPVKGQILTLGLPDRPPVCERIVATERVYMVPRPDARLIIGATVEEMGFDTRVTAGAVYELLREAYRALPDVAELELLQARAGLRPGTPDNAPLIGRGAIDGLILATGHYRNGILLAPVTADAIAAFTAGSEPPAVVAASDPARFRVRGDDAQEGGLPDLPGGVRERREAVSP